MDNQCECHRCIQENNLTAAHPILGEIPLNGARMILCPDCGNKRCPRASDHTLNCSDSNEPGQIGSVYY